MNILDELYSKTTRPSRKGIKGLWLTRISQRITHGLSRFWHRHISKTNRHSTKTCRYSSEARQQVNELIKNSSFLHRLNVRFPWLKIVGFAIITIILILNLTGVTVSHTYDAFSQVKIAPMRHHVEVIERNLSGKMLVALTFDDGPSALTTPLLLDTLKAKHVPATFFTLGRNAAANPELIRRIEAEGHEVASHSLSHQNLVTLSYSDIVNDLTAAKSALNDILGHGPSLIRPPYGNYNEDVMRAAGTPLIIWSVDTLDWKYKDTESILSNTTRKVADGAVILMHDIHPTTIEATPILIDTLREAGYEFVTVSELARHRGITLEPGAVYYQFSLEATE